MVKYENGQLVISIPSTAPCELHATLMQSVISSIKTQTLSSQPFGDHEKTDLYWIMELLENMLPDDETLIKINS